MKSFCLAIATMVITCPLFAQADNQKIPEGFALFI